MSEVVANFIAAMEAAGVVPAEPVAHKLLSGNLIRFRCVGDRPGKRNGWAVLYFDRRPAGAFGWYKAGIRQRWRAHDLSGLSAAERARMQREWAEARRRREQEREEGWRRAAELANKLWDEAGPTEDAHPYLEAKGIDGEGIAQNGAELLVPMYDFAGRIWNLQRIAGSGRKRFLKDGRTQGLFFLVGAITDTLCIGEGLSTVKAVRRATSHPVVAAFSAENLLAVAQGWRRARPDLDIIICADDDAHLISNPNVGRNLGRDYAEEAAREIAGRVAYPPRSA